MPGRTALPIPIGTTPVYSSTGIDHNRENQRPTFFRRRRARGVAPFLLTTADGVTGTIRPNPKARQYEPDWNTLFGIRERNWRENVAAAKPRVMKRAVEGHMMTTKDAAHVRDCGGCQNVLTGNHPWTFDQPWE